MDGIGEKSLSSQASLIVNQATMDENRESIDPLQLTDEATSPHFDETNSKRESVQAVNLPDDKHINPDQSERDFTEDSIESKTDDTLDKTKSENLEDLLEIAPIDDGATDISSSNKVKALQGDNLEVMIDEEGNGMLNEGEVLNVPIERSQTDELGAKTEYTLVNDATKTENTKKERPVFIMQESRTDSMAIYDDDESAAKPFDEDYAIAESAQPLIDLRMDMGNVDILRDLKKLARLRELELENEQALELLEVEASIKLAEEKLMPQFTESDAVEKLEESNEAVATSHEVTDELKMIDSLVEPADLVRMESSDYSEEEGYRQRLSCIIEESESDASGSGVVAKNKRIVPVPKPSDQLESPLTATEDVLIKVESVVPSPKTPMSGEPSEANEDSAVSPPISEEEKPVDEETNIGLSGESVPTPEKETEIPIQQRFLEKMESVETCESNSPEPRNESMFGIQRLKSGSHVEKLLTRPMVLKRRESSSDSSLDLSVTASTTGGDGDVNVSETDTKVVAAVGTAEEVSDEANVDSQPTDENTPRYILELTDEDLKVLFPKVRRGRRGKSVDTGREEKQKEEKKAKKKKCNSETSSQKGDEDRPPVPPETYLWEELRRWRMKGGYPWTHLDKPPFDEKAWKKMTDHEYEPVNPPPLEITPDLAFKGADNANGERHFLRIPRDDELVVSPEDMEVEALAIAQDLQDELDERFFATTPMTNGTSRTDCDVNTSMLDSSGLEDLPLKRDSRSKKAIQSKTEQMRAQAQGIQQRLRSQAGKLRNKLRSLPRPSFPKRQERPKEEGEEKPRFRLPDRPKFNLPDRSKFKMPQKPKISLPSFTKPLRERQNQTRPSTKKNIFDIDFKTYPRMFSKRSKDRGDYATSSPKMTRSATPPPAPIQPARKKGPVGQRWVNRFDDIKYVDDRESEISRRSDRSESLSGFHEKDFAIADDMDHVALPPARALSTKSSLSHLSDREIQSSRSSEDRLRKGVIEEIDSDQFFLRQKGISEEDIDMGKYLSDEIREAFRSPVVNALRQMDYDFDREIEKENIQEKMGSEDPLPPLRTRSLKKTPKRDTESAPKDHSERAVSAVSHDTISKPRYENIDDEDDLGEHYKTPPPPVEYQHYKVPKPVRPTNAKRKASTGDEAPNKKKENGWIEVEIETSLEEVQAKGTPQPLKRSKKSYGKQQGSVDEPHPNEAEPDYIIPESPPVAQARTRSLSRGARSLHSFAQEEDTNRPQPPKRTSSKSLHLLGQSVDEKTQQKSDIETKSLHSFVGDDASKGVEAPKRMKSLPRGAKSFHSLNAESNGFSAIVQPVPPERTRSLTRAPRSYHSIVTPEDFAPSEPQAPVRTRSLSRASKSKPGSQHQIATTTAIIHHYEAPPEPGYAVVDKGAKPKPPRPPPPRRKKGSQSPTFNTFPRRSPIRPVRNYATLGPSRPPRRGKINMAKSLEHIYTSDAISQSYAELSNTLQIEQAEDLHGSNKDLQAEDVVEKMKGRPLPAPPRPPRFRSRGEEQNQSMEEVEEVCVSTQTDPLPDDLCLEEDVIQEFSHEQLKLQEVFLQEMRAEEERIQREIEEKRARKIDVTAEKAENDAKMEIIRQMDDIIQEERRLLFDQRPGPSYQDAEDSKKEQLCETEDDMGYASLDRRQPRVDDDPQPSTSFQSSAMPSNSVQVAGNISPREPVYIPLVPEIVSTERLRVNELEVNRLSVNQLSAVSLQVQNMRSDNYETGDIRGTILQVQDITSRTGNTSIGNIEIPPDLVQQILLRIPWEELRPPRQGAPDQEVVKVPRKAEKGEEETALQSPVPTTVTRRRHRQLKQRSNYSSDEEEQSRPVARRHPRANVPEPTIVDLSRQLANACTTAGIRAMRDFAVTIQPSPESEERSRRVKAAIFVLLVAIAGFILMGFTGSDVHHHHWDFQFPPQPREP